MYTMNKLIFSISLVLLLVIPASALATTDFKVFVTANNAIHDLNIKATEGANGQINPVSGFAIDPEDVVQIIQGENLIIYTSTNEPLRIEKVKIANELGQFTELPRLSSGQWGLTGIPAGVYLLDVIVDTPDSNDSTAYETVLVILTPGQTPLTPIQYITQVQTIKVKVDTKVVFKDDGCSSKEGSAKMSYPYQGVNECEVDDLRDCKKNNIDSDYCEGLKERFSDDCDGFKNKEECDAFYNTPPLCDENTPPGVTCEDESDPDTCEEGFVDSGNGCEREYEICPAVYPPEPGCGGSENDEVEEEEESTQQPPTDEEETEDQPDQPPVDEEEDKEEEQPEEEEPEESSDSGADTGSEE
jgi:hypothetical protein